MSKTHKLLMMILMMIIMYHTENNWLKIASIVLGAFYGISILVKDVKKMLK